MQAADIFNPALLQAPIVIAGLPSCDKVRWYLGCAWYLGNCNAELPLRRIGYWLLTSHTYSSPDVTSWILLSLRLRPADSPRPFSTSLARSRGVQAVGCWATAHPRPNCPTRRAAENLLPVPCVAGGDGSLQVITRKRRVKEPTRGGSMLHRVRDPGQAERRQPVLMRESNSTARSPRELAAG